MRIGLAAAFLVACSGATPDGTPLDARYEDGGARHDADLARDGGSDAGEPDAGQPGPDAWVERDAGEADAGSPLLSCDGEGIWRNETVWCDHLASVLADYGCVLIFESYPGGTPTEGPPCNWTGTATDIRGLAFVLAYSGLSPYADRVYACALAPPSMSLSGYQQNCEAPLRRPCELAASYTNCREGVDYAALCDAAIERGDAPLYSFEDPSSGCS